MSLPIVAGVDVSKDKLDIFIHPLNRYRTFNNRAQDFAEVYKFLKEHNVSKVGFEATGGYEKQCAYNLLASGLQVYIIQPKWVKDYARSLGVTAKTDKIDSSIIASYISNPDMRATLLAPNNLKHLREVFSRREQLVEILKIQKTQKHQISNLTILKQLEGLILLLQTQIKDLSNKIKELISKEASLAEKYKCLTSIPGIGEVVATTLLCYIPELGSLKAKQIASLAGLAPMNFDSGKKHGKRFVQGGRMQVRRALYMSILTAKESNSYIKVFFRRLTEQAKKPFKIAATAAMRKLLILANALIRDKRLFLI
jgi:transposase